MIYTASRQLGRYGWRTVETDYAIRETYLRDPGIIWHPCRPGSHPGNANPGHPWDEADGIID